MKLLATVFKSGMRRSLLLNFCTVLGVCMAPVLIVTQEHGPVYTLRKFIRRDLNLASRMDIVDRLSVSETILSSNETRYEWESYDGWYNNPAHPEWGGAGKQSDLYL